MKTKVIKSNMLWFGLVLAYLVFDYGRPQDTFPIIGMLRPSMLLTIILTLFLACNGMIWKIKDAQIKYLWFFILLLFLYIPFARNSHNAYLTAKSQLLYMPLILSLISCVDSMSRLRKTINLLIMLMIYVAIYSILHNGKGPGNYLLDENDLCLYINSYLPFSYFLLIGGVKKWEKALYVLALVLGLIAVVISFSRGGFIGFVCMLIVAWIFSPKKKVALIIVCLFLLSMYYVGGDLYEKEMSSSTQVESGTAKTRLESWRSAWRMFLDHPLGVGGNNFQIWFPEYQTQYFKRNMWGRVAHSLWFTLLAELGILGVIIYVSILIRNFKDVLYIKRITQSRRSKGSTYFHNLSLAFVTSMIGFFVSASFLSVLYYAHYWYITGLIVTAEKVFRQTVQEA